MDSIIKLPYNDDIFFSNDFIEGLHEIGWNGRCNINNDIIEIYDSYNLTLEDYISKYGYLDYNSIYKLIICIGQQISILKNNNLGILFFSLSDILIINKNWFIINPTCNTIFPLDNNNIKINYPIKFNEFISCELEKINYLPFKVFYTCSYYSLAKIALYSLNNLPDNKIKLNFDSVKFENNENKKNKIKFTKKRIDKNLLLIKESKLYFILKGCLEENSYKRIFLIL